MAGFRKALVAAMGVKEDAALSEIHESFERMLADDMTDEEKAALAKKKEKAAGMEDEMSEGLKALRTTLGLAETATVKELAEAATTLKASVKPPSDAAMALEIKGLSERLALAEKSAKKADALEAQAKIDARDRFLDEQTRAGKLVPAERDFYIKMWESDEAAVRKYFADKKGTVVRLHERGTDLPGGEFSEKDPRETLKELADKRSIEKSIEFKEALAQVKVENPELVEQVAAGYGPPRR